MPEQEKSAVKSSYPERLKNLRLRTQQNWAEIAKMLAVSESMLYQVLRGDRALSDKAVWRLEALEGNAGLLWQDSETKSLTDQSIRDWILKKRPELEPPEFAFFLTAIMRVASEEMQRFLEGHQLRLEQKEVVEPSGFKLQVTEVSKDCLVIDTIPHCEKPENKA